MKKRERSLKQGLDHLIQRLDEQARIENDPIRFPKRYRKAEDQEIVSLIAALLSYGRVSAIGATLEALLPALGSNPSESALADLLLRRAGESPPRRFHGFVYRFTREADLERLWRGLGCIIDKYGNLGDCLRAHDDPDSPHLITAYQGFYDELISYTSEEPESRGFNHLFSNPKRGSALKRVNMWLRWLVRGPDRVDLGLWGDLKASRLIIPLDVHIFKLSHALGLTQRRSPDMKTAIEITEQLKRLATDDPIQYDFALAHLGISGECRGYKIADVCALCPLEKLCAL